MYHKMVYFCTHYSRRSISRCSYPIAGGRTHAPEVRTPKAMFAFLQWKMKHVLGLPEGGHHIHRLRQRAGAYVNGNRQIRPQEVEYRAIGPVSGKPLNREGIKLKLEPVRSRSGGSFGRGYLVGFVVDDYGVKP